MPGFGPEFDSHLKLELVDPATRSYKVVAPDKIGDLTVGRAWLVFFPQPYPGPDKPRGPLDSIEIELTDVPDGKVGRFQVPEIQPSLYASVEVHYHGGCGAVAEVLINPLSSK